MKIGLIADTQGGFDLEALLTYVAREFASVDEIWHAGDWGSEEVLTGLGRLGRLVEAEAETVVGGIGGHGCNLVQRRDGRQRWRRVVREQRGNFRLASRRG